jgi:hypothetical protein
MARSTVVAGMKAIQAWDRVPGGEESVGSTQTKITRLHPQTHPSYKYHCTTCKTMIEEVDWAE